jgi:photosystem II stability/assembly factor-like uncharacterized protein
MFQHLSKLLLMASFVLCTEAQAATISASSSVINADLNAIWVGQDGNFLLAGGAEGSILRSVDHGLNWQQTDVSGDFPVDQFAGDTHSNILALGEQGILHSADEGRHWVRVQLPGAGAASRLLFDAKRDRWLATNARGGMLRSADGGRSWQSVRELPAMPLLYLAQGGDGSIVAAGTEGTVAYTRDGWHWSVLKAATMAHVSRVLALGRAQGTLVVWSDHSVSLITARGQLENRAPVGEFPPTAVTFDVLHHLAFVGNSNGQVFRSADGGMHWESSQVLDKVFLTEMYSDPETGALTVVGARGTVARSTDGGATWSVLRGNEWNSRLHAVSASADHTELYAVGTGGMILRSADRGQTWQLVRADTHGYVAEILGAPDSDNILAVGRDGLLLRSSDAGKSWQQTASGLKTDVYYHDILRDPATGKMYICGPMSSLTRSRDGGVSWEGTQPVGSAGDDFFKQIVIDPVGKTLLLAGSPGRVMRSTDDGQAWQVTDADTSDPGIEQVVNTGARAFLAIRRDGRLLGSDDDGQHWRDLAKFPVETLGIYAEPVSGFVWVMGRGQLFRSADRGLHWQATELQTTGLNAMLRTRAGTMLGFGDAGTILRSTDDGQSWSKIPSGATPSLRKGVQDNASGRIYVPGREGSLLYSDDDGLRWQSIPTNTHGHLNRVWLVPKEHALIVTGERIVRIVLE